MIGVCFLLWKQRRQLQRRGEDTNVQKRQKTQQREVDMGNSSATECFELRPKASQDQAATERHYQELQNTRRRDFNEYQKVKRGKQQQDYEDVENGR